ncbi:tape measure protein, partial [Prosthecomicrobium pneumaticum]
MAAPLAGLGASLSVAAVVGYADAWTNAGNRLAAVGVPLDQVAAKQNELVQIAIRSRTEFGAVVDLYAKMASSAGTLGASQADVARVTETVAKALVLGGASAQEAAGTIRQLGQALGSGVLRGDELNSVLEQSPPIAQLIAKEFGVTTTELRALAEAGDLVSGRVFRGLLKGSDDIDRSVASMSLTVAQAAENFQTAFTAYVGSADQATGVTRTLAAAIQFMAQNFDLLESAAVLTAAALAGRLVSGLAAAGAGMSATALAARGLTGALALVGGPVGLAVTAAGGLLYLASQHDSAKLATEAHNDALRLLREQVAGAAGRSREYIDALAKEKEAQLQAAEADLQRAEAIAQLERAKAIELRQRGGFSMGLASGDATPGQSVGAIAGAMINPDAFIPEETLRKLEQGRERIAALRTAIEDLRSLAAGGGGAGTGTGTGGGRGSEV